MDDITCRNCGHYNHLWTANYKKLRNRCSWFIRNKKIIITCACKKWMPIDNLEYLEEVSKHAK